MTVTELIAAALRKLGVLAAGEPADASDTADALIALNAFVDQLATEQLNIYTVTRTTATLTASQTSFTVGSSGDINIARPVFIEKVNFVDTSTDPDTEYTLPPLLTEQQWEAIPQKALTGTFPQKAYYNPTYPTGTLHPWPIPTSATLLWALYHWTAVTEFSSLSTTIALPPGYRRMLISNLALELAPDYGILQPSPALVEQARNSLALVKRANSHPEEMQFPGEVLPLGWPGWDIHTGP